MKIFSRALNIASSNPCDVVVRALISKHVIQAKETDKVLRQPILS